MPEKDPDWLGELRWQGYPRLQPIRDVASAVETGDPAARPPRAHEPAAGDPRLAELARDNEALASRLADLSRLSGEFDRRMEEAATAYEGAVLEAESRLRDLQLERQRLTGELEAAKAECARLTSRDASREADLKLERERLAAAERAALEARRKAEEHAAEAERLRSANAEQAGIIAELRRQALAQNERLYQAKVLTDQDVNLLRQEMREFLIKFHRIQDDLGDKP